PRPGLELLLGPVARAEVDLALWTFEAGGEPQLFLASITALPGNADKLIREIVGEPLPRPRHEPRAGHSGLLGALAACARLGLLVFIQATLGHLPPRAVDAFL